MHQTDRQQRAPRHPSRAMRLARPIVASNPVSGDRAIMLTLDHAGTAYACTLEWCRHDAIGLLSVGLAPDPPDTRALLRVLVTLGSLLWAQRDRARARAEATGSPLTPLTRADQADVTLWDDAAHRVLVYRIALWDAMYADEERRAQPRPLAEVAATAPRTAALTRRAGR